MIIIVSALIICAAVTVYGAKDIKTYASNQPKSNDKKLMASDKFNSQVKDYNENEVSKNVKFNVKEPDYKYKNMQKVKVDGRNFSNSINTFDATISWYKTDDNKEIRIQQAPDTGKPEDLLARCKKIKIGDIDAWVYSSDLGDTFAQIMFWKDGEYFNVSGAATVDELIKISQSLK